MIKFLLALILVAQVSGVCHVPQFVGCQAKFSDALGIDRNYNWLNPLGLTIQIQDIYINGGLGGIRGLNSVCNAYNQMIQCLTTSQTTASECFNIPWLLSHSEAPNRAYSYGFLMNMLQYQCGAGFYIASDNWKCLQNIYAKKNGTMFGCINDFVLNAYEDPARGCDYVQTGMNCFEAASTLSGCPDELKYYGCESFRQYSAPQFSRCHKSCQVDLSFR
ncbi:unnamed protein product [Caenorhabditis angaria]|uniref:DUF19 domain-containing protein n=1 Tax=Caenorhabditis angaria TaxID=860376 RepID=A0A9P1IR25_9PELO|nr:unnamed protein product [Caenorhabditis angaria]